VQSVKFLYITLALVYLSLFYLFIFIRMPFTDFGYCFPFFTDFLFVYVHNSKLATHFIFILWHISELNGTVKTDT